VNYLSHYYIDHVDGNPYYNAGLLLPDISKDQVKSYKHRPRQLESKEHISLFEGCLKHYESDKRFHASGFFAFHQEELNQLVKSAPLSAQVQRRWFIAHVLFELLLDQLLVKQNVETVDRFYTSLDLIEAETLQTYLELFQAKNPEEFINRFGHFLTVRYIYYYSDTNKLVYSLSRIMLRAGLDEPVGRDIEVLHDLCLEAERRYFNNPTETLRIMRSIFA
jgi:hypothetical protein